MIIVFIFKNIFNMLFKAARVHCLMPFLLDLRLSFTY
jgi:hypothetical protein